MPKPAFLFDIVDSCTAFDVQTIGTKVVAYEEFYAMLDAALAQHDTSRDKVPGQHYIVLPPEAATRVSAGVGRRTHNPSAYVLRAHRGRVSAYLKREFAAQADSVAVVVYTREAYFADPDVARGGPEANRIREGHATHVIVAVLASAGPPSPLTPFRFVANLAGGNKEAQEWTADEIREKARAIVAYADDWDVVAD